MPPGAAMAAAGEARRFGLLALIGLLALLIPVAGLAQMRGPGPGASGPVEVGTITLETREVPYSVTLPGRAVAWQEADIRPRVSGVVAEILYDAGRPIATGDPMFRIEDDTYRVALLSAEAALRQSEAAVATAQSTLKRARSLLGTGSTQAGVEAAELALAQAEAGLSAAQAQHQIAQLDLDRTVMRSPIDGVADLSRVSIGAIVTANQADPLATVRRIDPIYVDVAESSASILRTRDRIRASELQPGEGLGVRLTLEDGRIHEAEGRMVSRGNAVSMSTGTATFRFAFDNPEALILPGQFLRVQVTLGTTRAVLVPQRATSRAADGRLTTFLLRDGRAEKVALTEAGTADNAWVVTEGAAAGDLVIVDGLQNLREGDAVTGVPVAISPDGVITDLPAGAGPATETGAEPADDTGPDGGAREGQGQASGEAAPAATPGTALRFGASAGVGAAHAATWNAVPAHGAGQEAAAWPAGVANSARAGADGPGAATAQPAAGG